MSEPQPFVFLKLPTELRLLVYRFLTVSTLKTGFPSDLWGLYTSCKGIHEEMESEVIAKTSKLLDAQSTWNTLVRTNNPLRISLPWLSSADFLPSEISIQVPELAAWVLCDGSPYFQVSPTIQYIFFDLFDLPVNLLTISCYLIPTGKNDDNTVFQRNLETMSVLFRASHKATFYQAGRFVLQLGADERGKDDFYLQQLLNGRSMAVREKKVPQNTKRTWLASCGEKECKSWAIGYDFKDELPKIGGSWQEVREWMHS